MYPYNCKTNLSQTEPTDLSKDQRLLDLLALSMAESMNIAKRYEALGNEPLLQSEGHVTKSMMLDQTKHGKLLQEAFFLITMEKPQPLPKGDAPTLTGKELLEDTLLLEIDCHNFYRTLYLSAPTRELENIFYEISTDKQSHASALTYLFAKYFS